MSEGKKSSAPDLTRGDRAAGASRPVPRPNVKPVANGLARPEKSLTRGALSEAGGGVTTISDGDGGTAAAAAAAAAAADDDDGEVQV